MKLQKDRKETPFSSRDNMLDIWTHCTELYYRGFGKLKRKMPRKPRNFNIWSQESQKKWLENQNIKLQQKEHLDYQFINREGTVLENMCRQIVFLIDGAYELQPFYPFEFEKMINMQDEAIIKCSNLKRQLNHLMDVIPCNKNFIVKLQTDIEKEIKYLQEWRAIYNKKQ